jgi:glycosyltransferase involved in cell wall biosynthesis
MPTQIVHLDFRADPAAVRLRDDIGAVLVLVTADGRPVALRRMPRPADGLLSSADVLSANGADHDGAPASAPVRVSPPVSVVVPTRERPDDLTRCLASLAGVEANGHEVIVVDSGPTSNRTMAVAERFGVRYLVESRPGANRARNAGLAVASRDIVAFVDDDVVVSPTWLAAIGANFADPDVGCATGLVLPLELETAAQEDFELYCQHRRDLHPHVYSRRVLRSSAAGVVGMGANMAFRRRLLITLGGFDMRLGPGTYTRTGDETDMFARVLDSGRLIVYNPDAYVWHRHRRSPDEERSCVFGYGVGLYSMLTKRFFEQRDFGALITGGRWLIGPLVKAVGAKIGRRPTARWKTVLAETAGAPFGPFCFAYEAWRSRAERRSAT